MSGMNNHEYDGNNQLDDQRQADAAHAEEREKEHKLGFSMLAKLTLAVLVITSLIISVVCVMKYNELEQERARLEEEVNKLNDKINDVQDRVNAPVDDDYIRDEAESLGYAEGGANIVVDPNVNSGAN